MISGRRLGAALVERLTMRRVSSDDVAFCGFFSDFFWGFAVSVHRLGVAGRFLRRHRRGASGHIRRAAIVTGFMVSRSGGDYWRPDRGRRWVYGEMRTVPAEPAPTCSGLKLPALSGLGTSTWSGFERGVKKRPRSTAS